MNDKWNAAVTSGPLSFLQSLESLYLKQFIREEVIVSQRLMGATGQSEHTPQRQASESVYRIQGERVSTVNFI